MSWPTLAGEQQVVERQAGEICADAGVAQHHADILRSEVARRQAGQQLAGARRELRHLDHHPVAGGERRGHGRNGEEQRVIPGHDDADHTQRLHQDARAAGAEPERGRLALRLHPAAKVRTGVAYRLQAGKQLQQAGFVRGAVAEVGGNGLDKAVAVVMHQIEQGIEPRLTDGTRHGGRAPGGGVHGVELLAEVAALVGRRRGLLDCRVDRVHSKSPPGWAPDILKCIRRYGAGLGRLL